MSDSPTPETDAEAVDGIDCYGDPLKTWEYKASKDGEVVPIEFARRLERERDKAREELAILKAECAKTSEEFGLPPTVRPADGEIKRMINGWREALEERDEARRDLVDSEELHRRRFGTLKAEFAQVMRERDEARRELVIQRYELMRGQKEVMETLVELRERLAAVTHPNKNEQNEEA